MSAVQTPPSTLAPRIAIGAIILYQVILMALIFVSANFGAPRQVCEVLG